MKTKRIIRKGLAILLALICVLAVTGCENPVTSVSKEAGKVEEYVFPEGGIITKAFFDELQGTVNTDVYPGKGENLSYVWTFNGKDITTPMDFNITITPNNDAASAVQAATGSAQVWGFQFADNANVPGKYNLRLNLDSKWDAQSVDLYNLDVGSNALNKVGTVKMDNSAENQYQTQLDKIPDGQPGPAAPGDIDDSVTKQCTLSVRCDTIWMDKYYPYLNKEKEPLQPKDGAIFASRTVDYHPGEMVFDVLAR